MQRLHSLVERVERLSGGSNDAGPPLHRISRAYVLAAWVMLAAAILLWPVFAASAVAFYVAAIHLRREGL